MSAPTSGREAFLSGWQPRANPHPASSVAAMMWLSDWWRANAECFADHIDHTRPLPAGAGIPIGLRDRNGQPIHIGDTLSFDERVWGGAHEFTVTLENGEVQFSGGPSDMDQYCAIVRRWDEQL